VTHSTAYQQSARQLCALLLRYPDATLLDLCAAMREAASVLPTASAEPLNAFLSYLAETEPLAVQQHYVETFDMRRKCSPYLTYWTFGDTRNRGMALLHFKEVYRLEGLTIDDSELPDHLSVVLEFAAQSALGEDLLGEHRAVLELLHRALIDAGSPYQHVLAAVLATTPPLSAEGARRMHQIAREGPPTETVGMAGPIDISLSPYGATDDFVTGGRR
jgi:nitrate reductase delta subunit